MNFKHDICRITISCFLIYKIIMKNIFFNKLKSIFTFKTTKHILNGCAGDILIEEATDYPIQSSKTGFDNHETITLDNIVNYLSSLPIWKKYNQKHSAKSTIGMADLAIKPKQVKTLLKHNKDSVKLDKQFSNVNKETTDDSYQSESSKTSNKDDDQNQFKQDCSVPLIDDVLDLAKQEQKQKENNPNPISSNLISAVDTKNLISENDGNQSTDISVVLPTVSDSATFSVVETNQYKHVLQEFSQRIAKMAKDTIVPLTFNHPFFEISYEKNPHFHFKDIQAISDSGLYELQETKELVSFPLFFYPVFTHESTGQVELNQTQETNEIYENHVATTVNEVNVVKKIKFLLEEDLDKDDYLESCLGGQIGLIYVDKEIIRQKYKVKRITKKIHDELVDEAKKLIKQLNQQ